MRALAITLVFIAALTAVTALAEPTPTNYYLPKGYKVHATIHVPCAPFFPGEVLGGAVGVSTTNYRVYVQAYAWKDWLNPTVYKSAVRVVWEEGGQRTTKADVQVIGCDYDLDVVITYDWSGNVVLAVARERGGDISSLFGFVGTVDRYTIIAEGASVDQPQQLPSPTDTSTGGGYNPPTASDIMRQYLTIGLLGGGTLGLGVGIWYVTTRRGGKR